MLSVHSDRPIQPAALTVIRAVDKVTKELGLAYFVIDEPSKLAWRQEAILRAQRVPSPLE